MPKKTAGLFFSVISGAVFFETLKVVLRKPNGGGKANTFVRSSLTIFNIDPAPLFGATIKIKRRRNDKGGSESGGDIKSNTKRMTSSSSSSYTYSLDRFRQLFLGRLAPAQQRLFHTASAVVLAIKARRKLSRNERRREL